MIKKILIVLLLLAALGAVAAAIVVRNLPELTVQNIRQTLRRDVSIGSLRVTFPLRIEMNRLIVTENEPFKGEVALFVEQANLSVDAWAFFTSNKVLFDDVELIRPRVIFRKSQGKMYHAFRIRPAPAAPKATGSSADSAATTAPKTPAPRPSSIPPLKFNHITIRDGEVQFIDYDTDIKGFVVTLLRMSAQIDNLALPSDGGRVVFELTALLDQGRQAPAGRLKLSGDWVREELDGKSNLELNGVYLPYFEPYYRTVTPSRISDGELDLIASSQSIRGTLMANSKWTLRRLSFDKTESGNELFGFDADLIQNILTGDSGNLSLDLVLNLDLRDRSTPFRDHLRRSLRQSIQATFLSNLDAVIKNTVNQIVPEAGKILNKQNWKDLLKKNKLDDVVDRIMNPK